VLQTKASDSWGMYATSVACRTIMIFMLMVMSGTDSHIIRVTWIGMIGMFGWLVSCSFRSNYCSGLCGRFNVAFRGEEFVA
jgi:hypothetical protein